MRKSNHRTTYQRSLRALGAFLDREPAYHITLIEILDGFVARFHRSLSDPEPMVLDFHLDALEDQLVKLSLLRRQPVASETRHEGLWSSFPKGHQDFFRALGFELDQQCARWLMIDELEDSLVVSYRHPHGSNTEWRKRVVVMGTDEIEKVVRAAIERRKNPQA